MKTDKLHLLTGQSGYFFVIVNLLVGIAIFMAAISIGIMFYGGLQFMGN